MHILDESSGLNDISVTNGQQVLILLINESVFHSYMSTPRLGSLNAPAMNAESFEKRSKVKVRLATESSALYVTSLGLL